MVSNFQGEEYYTVIVPKSVQLYMQLSRKNCGYQGTMLEAWLLCNNNIMAHGFYAIQKEHYKTLI